MAQTINKDGLVDKLQLMDAFANSSKKVTKEFLEDFFDLIATEVIAGNTVSIPGFGKIAPFEKQDGSLKPKFTAFTAFKEAVKASK